jgi:hypothetical protein
LQITASMSEAERKRYKLVRMDSYADIAGLIVEADESTGKARLTVAGEQKTIDLGPHGFRIMPVDRYARDDR